MTKIKLCGMTKQSDIEAANELSCDFVGFIFSKKSKRYVSPDAALRLKSALSGGIRAVGVFVNEEPRAAAYLADEKIIDIIQLHGDEDEEYIKELRRLTSAPIIKAIGMKSKDDAEAARRSSADAVLLDSANAGSGKSFDTSLAKNLGRKYFLAGGLTPENVKDAVLTLAPFGVDVSSGIETLGAKDPVKMRNFVLAVRLADKILEEKRRKS